MSFPLEGLLWLVLAFGFGGTLLRIFSAWRKSDKSAALKSVATELLWPRLNDSSVIVFHYTCVAGIVFVALAIAVGRVQWEWENFSLHPASVQGALTVDQASLRTNETNIVLSGNIRFDQAQEMSYRLTFRGAWHAFWAVIFGLVTISNFTTLMCRGHRDGLRTASGVEFQEEIRAKTKEIHDDLRSRNIDVDIAEDTLLRSIHHFEELDPTKDPSETQVVPEIHLVLAVDSVLPNPYRPPVTTVLFSQLHTIWARRYPKEEQNAAVAGKLPQDATDVVPRYFRSNDNDDTAYELDRLLTSSLKVCRKQLAENHKNFGTHSGEIAKIPLARVVRLLFGSAESLVHTAADFQEFPESAFPLLDRENRSDRVLNLWIRRVIGRTLCEVAQNGGKGNELFQEFDPTWGDRVKDYLYAHGVRDFEFPQIFKHSLAFSQPEKEWHDLDCFVIGSRLFQEGYRLRALEERRLVLTEAVGLLPIFVSALHFKQILSFPDIIRHVNSHMSRARTEGDKSKTRDRLVNELEQFQDPDKLRLERK